ncbi:MAG: ATP synthase F0 subunit C [Bdellovibrionales bacterium]
MKKLMLVLVGLVASAPAWAQEAVAAVTHSGLGDKGFYALGGGIILGLAALGGTLGQGKIGAAAMDGIARNPQAGKDMFTPMMIGLALVESLVILAFALAFLFQMKM